jgi:alcohol dehydrogenase (cytochrome c)
VIKGTPLQVNGMLYVTFPDHVWAADARTGREVWHYSWRSKGGWHIGNRGAAVLGNALYFETPDCNLVSLNLKDGTERWHTEICDLEQFYYASVAPIIVKNHVITGVSGDDLDIPGYIESHDPETGALQWRWYAHPQPGDPEAKTWPNIDAMMHGGGMTWVPSTYDPELNLIYFGTGNPQPVIAGKGRQGDNLYTECIIALNPDTGKLVWYFQPSPHDTHDWDAVQTPVLFDGEINGQPRKLLAQASRNGWFFVLDRTNGKSVITSEYVKTNWAKGVDAKGQPIPNPAKEPQLDGALVSPNQGGAANWPPPSFNPETGLFYINATRAFSVYYLYGDDDKPEGWGGNDRSGFSENLLQAIDYKTGKVRWSHKWEGSGGARSGLLSTAGKLLFAGDAGSNLVALDSATGTPLWHAGLHTAMTNGPITYELDGIQYLVVGAGDSLYAFAMLVN